jgi:TfoX/Sxy family transcriptional regulator of competence genes
VPYSESLAERVRTLIASLRGYAEKKMFGGVGFLLHGNMCVGIWQDSLIVRVGAEQHDEAMAKPFAKPFDITGRPMTGWVMVEPDGLDSDRDLRSWVESGIRFAISLPARQDTSSSRTKRAPKRQRPARDRKTL